MTGFKLYTMSNFSTEADCAAAGRRLRHAAVAVAAARHEEREVAAREASRVAVRVRAGRERVSFFLQGNIVLILTFISVPNNDSQGSEASILHIAWRTSFNLIGRNSEKPHAVFSSSSET